MTDQETLDLLRFELQPAPGGRRWYGGPTLLGAVRGVSVEMAAWLPPEYAGYKNSIWRLLLHCAYWEAYVARKFEGASVRERFPRPGGQWPTLPDALDERAWAADRALCRDTHQRLVAAVETFDPARLLEHATEQTTYADFLLGVTMHNTHHTAQMQALKRMGQIGK